MTRTDISIDRIAQLRIVYTTTLVAGGQHVCFFRFITTISFFLCLVVTFAIGQQAGKQHCIAIVVTTIPVSEIAESRPYFQEVFKELRRLGYIEGQNLVVNRYTAEGHEDRFPAIARESVSQRCDVIVAFRNSLVARLKEATNTIPIVGAMADPVASGIVSNLARPGGNITGVSVDAGLEIWVSVSRLPKRRSRIYPK